jgi:dipeptidyl aminopeptidase/acylaminoacyl peptidase
MRILRRRRFAVSTLLAALAVLPSIADAQTPADTTAPRVREEDVRYRSGELTLAALLLAPEGEGRRPGAVIIQGSGTSDRTNQWARAIADELVKAGVVVLLTDKRGSGASEGDWRSAGFDELAADALAGVAFLRARPEVDPERVGVVGLSQGGWIAPVAAADNRDVAFVLVVSGATTTFAEQSHLEMANTARQAGLADSLVAEVVALNHAAGAYLQTGDWAPYDAARRRGLTRPWARIAEGYPATPDAPVWAFLRKVYAFDPIPYWRRVTRPVAVFYGAEDEHDNVPVQESVRRLAGALGTGERASNYGVFVIPGVGHALTDHQTHQLSPIFVHQLRAWMDRVTHAPR